MQISLAVPDYTTTPKIRAPNRTGKAKSNVKTCRKSRKDQRRETRDADPKTSSKARCQGYKPRKENTVFVMPKERKTCAVTRCNIPEARTIIVKSNNDVVRSMRARELPIEIGWRLFRHLLVNCHTSLVVQTVISWQEIICSRLTGYSVRLRH